ncbi:hypothetical protein [Millisia brevis]|uniref:hypothetical protein n=1 Tax=Millisia brevis TaxID=264148 RepID=UPI0012EDCA4B|nr:hypothetical protein [Millisia brevis]
MESLSLSERIRILVETAAAAGRTETDESIAAAVAPVVGRPIETSLIREAIEGDAVPADDVLEAIAAHFSAPRSYLLGSPEEQARYLHQLELFTMLSGVPVSLMALRSGRPELSAESVSAVGRLIESTHERYGAPDPYRSS